MEGLGLDYMQALEAAVQENHVKNVEAEEGGAPETATAIADLLNPAVEATEGEVIEEVAAEEVPIEVEAVEEVPVDTEPTSSTPAEPEAVAAEEGITADAEAIEEVPADVE